MKKINNSESVIKAIRSKAKRKKRIVFVSGTFNIVHPGHLRFLRFAAECGDFLVVGVLADRLASAAHLKQDTRFEGVVAISWVDQAFILEESAADFISKLEPAIVVMGKEHEYANNPEQAVVQSYGGQLLFSSGAVTFSSLELLRHETELIDHSSIIKPLKFIENHGIDISDLGKTLEKMRALKICVIGDTIVDEYIQCDPLGMSQEDPTIVVTPIMTNKFLGGAAIVAAHARGLGAASVNFISVTGDDEDSIYVEQKLAEFGVISKISKDSSRPTTLKQRYRVGNKTLLRVSHLRQHKISKPLQQRILDHVIESLIDADLLIISDFNYGLLPQELVDELMLECNKRGVMVVADSQSSSQVGDVSRYKNTSLLTPTEREARLALGNYEDGLVVVAEALKRKSCAENVVITLGAEGLLIHSGVKDLNGWVTDRLPALNISPKDTAGAGDCLLVGTSMAMVMGKSIWESLYIGSIAAACQVGRIGNTPITATELLFEATGKKIF